MKIVYTHENKLLTENAKNFLAQNGIESFLKNEFASGAAGMLSAVDIWPELWIVNDADESRANTLLQQLTKDTHQEVWTCPQCQEINEPSFDVCWNCQHEH